MSTIIEKTNVLRKEFLEHEVNHDELITINQLYMVLDRKARKQFDRDVGQQLHDRMNHDYKGRISVDEFIKVWLQAEEILKNKIDSCKRCLQDYHKQRKEAAINLEVNNFSIQKQARMEERVNQFGVMEGSTLVVTLVMGDGFQTIPFYVMLQLGTEKVETGQSKGPSPIWNLTFSFKIETGLEELQLFFISMLHPQNPALLGTLTISLSHLFNQQKHEEMYKLYSKDGEPINSRVRLGLHWIYSTTKYLEEVVEKWNEHIQQQEDDLLDYERDLSTLYEPFPSLIKIYQQLKPSDLSPVNKHQPMNTFIVMPVSNPHNLPSDLLTISRILTLVIMLFALISCFQRTEFPNFLICFAFITCFEWQILNKQTLSYLWGAFAVSSILDVAWLVYYSKNWWTLNQQEPDKGLSPEQGFLRVVLVMVYFELFAKFMNLVVLAILAQRADTVKIPDTKSPPGIQHNDISGSTNPQGF